MFASFHHEKHFNELSIDTLQNRKIWSALAFQAGWINAGGFLACHRFVTHITGFATQFGADIAFFSWKNALGMLTVPLFFLLGSMISAYYVDRAIRKKKKVEFHILFFLISFFLFLVTVMGMIGLFGTFGQQLDIMADYILIAFLCLSSGIQNAAISTASHNLIRTTHLTGITTDLGIGLVRAFNMETKEQKWIEKKKNEIRLIIIFSFVFGTTCGCLIFTRWHYLGFIVPCFISYLMYKFTKKGYLQDA